MRLRLAEQAYDLTHRALVIGVLNRTHDSFSDADRSYPLDAFLRRAEQHVADGADILDIGARAAGVGARSVSLAEETDLVCEAVIALLVRFDVPISVDSPRAGVAAAAFAAGAVLGNDMSGFRDPAYLPAAARAGVAVVATHTRLPPGVPDPDPIYDDVVEDVASTLTQLVDSAVRVGIDAESILVDPGLDLGKTWQQSVRLLGAVPRFAALGHPVLVAASNKIFLGELLGRETSERHDASVAACAIGAAAGARVFRVHDVRGARDAVDLACAATGSPGAAWWQRNNWSG
jgi:dihydropteroate synthase